MTDLIERLASARTACGEARVRVETIQVVLSQRGHERDTVETRIRRSASADDLDATRAVLLDREALTYIVQSLEPQLASTTRDERAVQDQLTEATREVARWRAKIDQFEQSLQPGDQLDRELTVAIQQRDGAERQIATLQEARAQCTQ